MSRKGNGWGNKRSAVSRAVRRESETRHNAPTESGFNRFGNERVPGGQPGSQADMKATSFECIEGFYNRKRPLRTWAICLLHRSWRSGSALRIRKNRSHDPTLWKTKQRKPQVRPIHWLAALNLRAPPGRRRTQRTLISIRS